MGQLETGRRTALKRLAGAAAVSAALPTAASATGSNSSSDRDRDGGRQPTIVLIHGSWHGSWCWGPVRALLQREGFQVFSPTLTGLSERERYGSLATGLTAHVDEIAKLLAFEDLNDVVLVGHSYAGMILTGVAELTAPRIRRLVYYDAFVPLNGQRAFDFLPPPVVAGLTAAAQGGNGWGYPPVATELLFGPEPTPAQQAYIAKLTPNPLATHTEAVVAPMNRWLDLPRTYISNQRFPLLDAVKTPLRSDPSWTFREIDDFHDSMLSSPRQVARLIIEAATRRR